ncbi:MAG: hypothetical protein F6K55_25300 [Moorea sp. SIO4A3]|nr:hypothetical protein [Moorena sp. SIO4A3]
MHQISCATPLHKIFKYEMHPPIAYCLLPIASCLLPLASCLLPIGLWKYLHNRYPNAISGSFS